MILQIADTERKLLGLIILGWQSPRPEISSKAVNTLVRLFTANVRPSEGKSRLACRKARIRTEERVACSSKRKTLSVTVHHRDVRVVSVSVRGEHSWVCWPHNATQPKPAQAVVNHRSLLQCMQGSKDVPARPMTATEHSAIIRSLFDSHRPHHYAMVECAG